MWVVETDSRSESGCCQRFGEFERKQRDAEVGTEIIDELKKQEDDTSKYHILYLWLSEFSICRLIPFCYTATEE